MRASAALVCVVACVVASSAVPLGQQAPPAPPATPLPWAYPLNAPPAGRGGAPPPQPDPAPRRVPGSTIEFTQAQLRDLFNVPDWHPDNHPAMPEVVAHGRKPDVRACGYCHLPNGQGRPENSSLAGLPPAYIEQQMADFRAGRRKSSGAADGTTRADAHDRESGLRRRIGGGGRVLRVVPVQEMDSRRRAEHGAEDPRSRRHARAGRGRRHRAHRAADHRDARGSRAHRSPRLRIRFRRVCAAWDRSSAARPS